MHCTIHMRKQKVLIYRAVATKLIWTFVFAYSKRLFSHDAAHIYLLSGVLVVNVTWRGKTYVGTLLDATRHDWAPPR